MPISASCSSCASSIFQAHQEDEKKYRALKDLEKIQTDNSAARQAQQLDGNRARNGSSANSLASPRFHDHLKANGNNGVSQASPTAAPVVATKLLLGTRPEAPNASKTQAPAVVTLLVNGL